MRSNPNAPSFLTFDGWHACLTPHFKQQMQEPRLGNGNQTAAQIGITPALVKSILPAMFSASNGETCGATVKGANIYWRTAWSTRRNRLEVEVISITPADHLTTRKHRNTRRVNLGGV